MNSKTIPWIDLSPYGIELRMMLVLKEDNQRLSRMIALNGHAWSKTLERLGFVRQENIWVLKQTSIPVAAILSAFPLGKRSEVPVDSVLTIVDQRARTIQEGEAQSKREDLESSILKTENRHDDIIVQPAPQRNAFPSHNDDPSGQRRNHPEPSGSIRMDGDGRDEGASTAAVSEGTRRGNLVDNPPRPRGGDLDRRPSGDAEDRSPRPTEEPQQLHRAGGAEDAHPIPSGGDRVLDVPEQSESVTTRPQALLRRNPRHHIITDELDRAGGFAPKARFAANIQAIRLLRTLEASGREATPEEKRILAGYVSWGGLSQAVDVDRMYMHPEWRKEKQEIVNLIQEGVLTHKELETLQASTLNAHYTSPEVVRAVWAAVEKMGYAPAEGEYGRILEPSVGTGNFLGLAPPSIIERSQFTAVEMEPLAGGIARQLYPEADIHIMPFEAFKTPLKFDVVIGNVPFGHVMPYDPDYLRESLSIHNYFLVRALDMTKPGGLVALVTSSYTLDAPSNRTVRELLAERGELMAAIRLPTSAFEAQANTTVTTDILFFRRPLPGENFDRRPSWLDTDEWLVPAPHVKTDMDGEMSPESVTLNVNRYYIEHPEMVASDAPIRARRHRYAAGVEIQVDMPADLSAKLRDIVERHVPKQVFGATLVHPLNAEQTEDLKIVQRDVSGGPERVSRMRVGTFVIMPDGGLGEIAAVDSSTASVKPFEAPNTKAEARIRAYIGVRDALLDLMDAELASSDDTPEIQALRDTLNARYDAFVREHGPLNLPVNERLFSEDTLSSFILGMENYNPETRTASKGDVFFKRTLGPRIKRTQAETPEDALTLCLSEHGRIIPQKIAEYLNQPWVDVYEVLRSKIFLNPVTNTWETADRYLSGNVVEKLEAAQAAAKNDPFFTDNVTALEAVQPVRIRAEDIHVQLGSPWIPAEVYESFVYDLIRPGRWNPLKVEYNAPLQEWKVSIKNKSIVENFITWGTERKLATEMIEDLLNQREIRIYDKSPNGERILNVRETVAAQNKAAAIQQEFKKWLWSDEKRTALLEDVYNRRFNTMRIPSYDGSHLAFPGMSSIIELRPHQKNAIWNYLQEGVLIAAHEVGLGKTFMMVAAAMEARRLGLARKPLAVVPNHMVEQFANEARQLYPTANILVMDKNKLTPKNRQAFLGRAVMQDWDLCIISQSQFARIPLSPEVNARFLEQEVQYLRLALQAIEEGVSKNLSIKRIQNRIENYETKIKKLLNAESKDATLYFDHLGFDMLLVDEAHHYKNRETPSRLQGVAGINTSGSERTTDMVNKILHLYEKNGGERGLIFATGTPISNSLTEVFNLIRTVKPSILKAWGTESFDAFVAQFMEKKSQVEVSADSVTHKVVTRLQPVNVPEMMLGLRTIMDVQRAEDHQDIIRRPDAETIMVTAERSYLQEIFSLELAERAKACAERRVPPEEDNILKIASDGRKASLDLRLIDPALPDFPDSKVNMMVERVHQVWRDHHDTRAAQIIFCDQGTPDNKVFSVYDDVRTKLVERGIPLEEIAFIHEAKDDEAKEALFERVRSGEVRILMGSTEKMGTGTNVQRRLIAIHHLDAPWRPSDIEQRDGRILRQGNQFDQVQRYIYTTRGSFDTFMWQLMKAKADAIQAIMRCDPGVRTVDEDVDTTYEDVLAVTTGNVYIKEKIEIERQITLLEAEERASLSEMRQAAIKIKQQETLLQALAESRSTMQGLIRRMEAYLEAHPEMGLTLEQISANRACLEKQPIWTYAGQAMTRQAFAEAMKTMAETATSDDTRRAPRELRHHIEAECLGVPLTVEFSQLKSGAYFLSIMDDHQKAQLTTGHPWRVEEFLSTLPQGVRYNLDREGEVRQQMAALQEKAASPVDRSHDIDVLRKKLAETIQRMNEESERIMEAMRAKGGYQSIEEWKHDHLHLLNKTTLSEIEL